MTSIVGPHQTCGIRGRSILNNIHVARSILECCDAWEGRVAMMQLDMEKAFDRVVHSVLFSILEHVNVGNIILEGLKLSYEGCSTNLLVNKQLSGNINLCRSIKQGCPASSLLFAIYLEPFCLKVIHNEKIRGFRLMGSEVKILSYADDVAVFCGDKESVRETVKQARTYCNMSGSAVNWEKCAGFWHGSWDEKPNVFENLQWTVSPTKYLGAPLNWYDEPTEYWREEAERMRQETTKWGGKNLSIFTRSTICNTFLVARIWYVLQVLAMSRTSAQKFHRILASFVWNSTWERTSRLNLFHSLKAGGLGLAHLFLRQIVSRFIFLRDQHDPFLRAVLQVRLQNVLPEFIVSSCGVTGSGLCGYLREVVSAFKILRVRFSFDYLIIVSKKQLYKDLRDVMLPVPLYRAIFSVGPGKDVLKRVKKCRFGRL